MRYKRISSSLFTRNRNKLYRLLPKNSLVILHSNDEMLRNGDQFFPYRQHSDFFYLTGIEQEKSMLILCPSHPEKEKQEVLFVLKPDDHMETWNGKKLTFAEASSISGIENIQYNENFESFFKEMTSLYSNIYINLDDEAKITPEIESRDTHFYKHAKASYISAHWHRLAPYLKKLRLNKEPEELDCIKEAISITNKAFHNVLKIMKPGLKEYELEAEITHAFIRNGASGHAYAPIVASGANACTLHYINNHSICMNGELVLMDFGAEYANYAADCSRTIPVNGKFSPRQLELYQSVLYVFNEARKLMIPGNSINEINERVTEIWMKEHIKLSLYTESELLNHPEPNELVKSFYLHGISHFIGLDVHDKGDRSTILQPGMVLSCEPGIYILSEKIGIRLENDILITQHGNIDLMEDIPMDPHEIERLMGAFRG